MGKVLSKLSRQSILREVRDYVCIVIGMVLYGIGWTVFLLPNEINVGGLPGVSSIIYWASGISVQYTYFAFNAILLVLSIKILGWRFSMKTIFAVFTLTFFLLFVEQYTKDLSFLQDEVFMSCVLGATMCGAGIGITFTFNGSSGGTDIIAAIVNKYRDLSLGRIMMLLNMTIVTCSYFVLKDWGQVVYGYVTLYVMSFVIDKIMNSTRSSVQFFIISKKYEEIGREINALHRGVTVIDGTGLYTGNPQKIMFVLAKWSQSNEIFQIINDIDPSAFVSQTTVVGVYGEGFDVMKKGKRIRKENRKTVAANSEA